jgi:mitogen-activated protein kinase kinase kinase 4
MGKEYTDVDYELFDDEDVEIIEPHVEAEQMDELRRFGIWSNENKELGLPSYISAFIFLSLIPLEVIHEFLRMRLETQPQKPNPLSLEQLLKELREGLTLAMIHRDRFHKHIQTALCDRDAEMEKYENILEEFDETVRQVFRVRLKFNTVIFD